MRRYGSPYDSAVEAAYSKAVCDFQDYQFWIEDFVNWLRMRYGSKLKLVGVQEMNKGGVLLPHVTDMPCENRWSESYLRRRIARLYCIDEWMKENNIGKTTMMTVTLSHGSAKSMCGEITIPQAFEIIKKRLRMIMNRISAEMPGIQCVVVFEPHMNGYYPGFPHVHVLYFGVISEKLQDQVKRLWSEKYKIGSYDRGVTFEVSQDNLQSGRNYVMKYLWKQLMAGMTEPAVIVFNAVAWKKHFRLFSMSPGLNAYADEVWEKKIGKEYHSDEDLDDGDVHVPESVKHCKTYIQRDDWVNPVREVKVPKPPGKFNKANPKRYREYKKNEKLLNEAFYNMNKMLAFGETKDEILSMIDNINNDNNNIDWKYTLL